MRPEDHPVAETLAGGLAVPARRLPYPGESSTARARLSTVLYERSLAVAR